MIKAQTIIAQMQQVLPTKTSLFSSANISIASLSANSGIVTAITNTPHGLTTGNYITVVNAKTPIGIASAIFTPYPGIGNAGGIVTIITSSDHDYTEGFGFQAEIQGLIESEYNGTFDVISVPNRRTFTYEINTNPSSPATGSGLVLNILSSGYNGYVPITVIDAVTFTYTAPVDLLSPAYGMPIVRAGARISGAISIDRIKQAYTKQAPNKAWAFVVLGDNYASKDRHISTDAVNTLGPGDAYRLRMICPFSVYVILPCTDEVAGRDARDTMEDVRVALYRTVLRVAFTPVLSEEAVYSCTALGDRYIDYTGAYYIHEFMFETVCDIIIEDTVSPAENRAFRNLDLIFNNPDSEDGDDIIMQTLDVDLDTVPL